MTDMTPESRPRIHGHVDAVTEDVRGDEIMGWFGNNIAILYDTADFDEAGGQFVIDGDPTTVYTYTGLSPALDAFVAPYDEAELLTGVTPDLPELEEGTRIDVWNPQAQALTVEWVATVVDDTDNSTILATITHAMLDMLADGVRGLVGESVVCERDEDGEWWIIGLLGKVPMVDGSYIDPETAPVKPGLLDDVYAQANANAAAAAAAAASATTALNAANGKNKVTYSAGPPGSTANTVGDIWFQKDVPTQTIIGQWEGLGGTSWSPKTLRNEVIANLDAGKLVAGSAFTNALWVKTNFTLGDASTNGVIQSYDFANQPVGVLIDKTGLVAKGGSIAGAQITGATITGGIVRTAVSGQRVQLSPSGNASEVSMYSSINLNPATLYASDDPATDGAKLQIWSGMPSGATRNPASIELVSGSASGEMNVRAGRSTFFGEVDIQDQYYGPSVIRPARFRVGAGKWLGILDYGYGFIDPDGSGEAWFNHGGNISGSYQVFAQSRNNANLRVFTVIDIQATRFKLRVQNDAGAAVTAANQTFSYFIIG